MNNKKPFQFRKGVYLIEALGLRAANLNELLHIVTMVDAEAILFHLLHPFTVQRYMEPEYPNDFAHWAGKVLGDYVVAEKLSLIDLSEYYEPEALRREVSKVLAEYLLEKRPLRNAPEGLELNLTLARRVVLPTGLEAYTREEISVAIARVDSLSIFYHLYEAPLRTRTGENDFALWAKEHLHDEELAQQLREVQPYLRSIEGSRAALLEIFGGE